LRHFCCARRCWNRINSNKCRYQHHHFEAIKCLFLLKKVEMIVVGPEILSQRNL
jgi:hypothetical protein